MQNTVNAQCVIDKIVYYFGEDNVQTCDAGIVKLHVKELANDIKHIADCLVYANVQVKRSGKGLIILFIPRVDEGNYCCEMQEAIDKTWGFALSNESVANLPDGVLIKKQPRVRDFYENLPQEARMKAFDNTAKTKWDMPVNSLEDAILRSFYINHSPEGTEYWQDVILENSGMIV